MQYLVTSSAKTAGIPNANAVYPNCLSRNKVVQNFTDIWGIDWRVVKLASELPFAYCLNTKMVRVVNVRSMLYMNNVGKVITEDLGYKLRVGNNTIDFNEDDAM